MNFAAISASEKFWEVMGVILTLEGEEREQALRRLQIPASPMCSSHG